MLSLQLVDCYLYAFEFTIEEKRTFCAGLSISYKKELAVDTENSRAINAIFREKKNQIIEYMSATQPNDVLTYDISKMQSEINTLYRTNKNKFKHTNLHYLVAQYIHMMMNRLFLSRGREYETIAYVMLEKYYA